MIQTDNLVQWQIYSEKDDAIFPWFTHPFLQWLDAQDLSNARVLEFGGGRSTRWWRKRAAWVTTIETNIGWFTDMQSETGDTHNGIIISKPINEGDQSRAEEYVNAGDAWAPYNVVVVDGILRNSCLEKALKMPRPLLLIADNWIQSGVWMSPAAEALMASYKAYIFEQPDHTDNDGINKWKTVFWLLK